MYLSIIFNFKWYFKIHQNTTSPRGGERYLGSFEISRAGTYPKYPEKKTRAISLQGKEISHFT